MTAPYAHGGPDWGPDRVVLGFALALVMGAIALVAPRGRTLRARR